LEWRNSPLQFVLDCIQVTPTDQQAELLHAMRDSKRVSVHSGHGVGKDACAAWIILWFLVTRAFSRVACTAPTAHQLADVLWSEIAKWLRKSILADEFVHQKDKIFHKSAPKTWWCRALSVNVRDSKEAQAETLAGLHEDHLLVIVDEASGVPDPVFIPLEGALTKEDNKVLLIGNPTKKSGYFYDTHYHAENKKAWTRLQWDARKSSNVDPAYSDYMLKKYGEQSNTFRIRVAGLPPLADEESLIPAYAAEQCIGKELYVAEDEPLYLGVDVARYGSDDSVILPREGNLILPWSRFNGMNTIDLGGHILTEYSDHDAKGCAIDVIGVGAGVADWLQKHGLSNLFMVNVAGASSSIEKADRLRDELWLRVRDKCLMGLYSFPDVKHPDDQESLGMQLAGELSSVRYAHNPHGGIKVESKKELKSRGIASPNIADALCLTEYFANVSTKVFRKREPTKVYVMRRPIMGRKIRSSQSWMAN